MEIIQWCKMQIMCLLILVYIGRIYIKEGNYLKNATKRSYCNVFFDVNFVIAEIAVLFDAITACTVNYLEIVPRTINLAVHLGMFVSYEIFIALLFWYWVSVTVGIPKRRWIRVAAILPSVIAVCLTIFFLPEIEFIQGTYTNYSMGTAVYICFISVAIHILFTVIFIAVNRRHISERKMAGLASTLVFIVIILTIQIVFPEALVSCIAVALILVSVYLNMENPSIHGLEYYHNEMVMGFATLIENKDDNTGGHIRRSSAYALLIAKNMSKNKKYKNLINQDYLNNLNKAAPMHDIGKIGIPDAVLQKPGRLTKDEFEIIKKHPGIGGKIVKDTFGHLFDSGYETMAYDVAMYHHEKWNGKGYPEGLTGTEIPLCARIMAVADVFDAVSAKRCYRDAMPLEECYRIIRNGRGEDFDPEIVDAFLMDKSKVEEIYYHAVS
ncbi:MAG: HD-GYP domain-containing protein [Candidatus Limivivens sp.]|nr:HD-GYP domain-containing protein [Candidatus Limivivens sp.]